MCAMAEIASCQLSFIPIQSEDYLSDVDKVLKIIAASGLEYSIGEMSTLIKGNKSAIFSLLEAIYNLMAEKCSFVMDARLSNICGCGK